MPALSIDPFYAVVVIPTGVGAAVGGFAGDASVAAGVLAAAVDGLITHPNVLNAAVLQHKPANALYVEGHALDAFCRGRLALRPVRANRVGLVWDAGIEPAMLTLQRNVVRAVQQVHGVDIAGEVVTAEPLRLRLTESPTGATTGQLDNPAVWLAAARQMQQAGATALALCARLPDPPEAAPGYLDGQGVDPIGGIEALLSHLVAAELGLPCAHAPVFDAEEATPITDRLVHPRSAAEVIAPTFLPCVLLGLAHAPQWIPIAEARPTDLTVAQVGAVVAPWNALGGPAVLAALSDGIPVLAVRENPTVMAVSPEDFSPRPAHLIPVESYAEAAGVLVGLRAGYPISAILGTRSTSAAQTASVGT